MGDCWHKFVGRIIHMHTLVLLCILIVKEIMLSIYMQFFIEMNAKAFGHDHPVRSCPLSMSWNDCSSPPLVMSAFAMCENPHATQSVHQKSTRIVRFKSALIFQYLCLIILLGMIKCKIFIIQHTEKKWNPSAWSLQHEKNRWWRTLLSNEFGLRKR